MVNLQIEEKLFNFLNAANLTFSCSKYCLDIRFTSNYSVSIVNDTDELVFTWQDFIDNLQQEYDPSDLQRLLNEYEYYQNTLKPFIDYGIVKPVEVIEYEYAE